MTRRSAADEVEAAFLLDELSWQRRPGLESSQDRSIGSGSGSRSKMRRRMTEISTCTRSEQMRRRERLSQFGESSQPRAWRRRRKRSERVVPLPRKGSRTRSPSLEEARRMRSRRATGFAWGACRSVFLPGLGREDLPDGLHLLAAVEFLHERVVEGVAALGVFGGPDDGFGGVGEIAAGEIGRRVGLDPGDVVEELEAELLHGEADGMNDVAGAGDPDGAVGFQDALAGGEPGQVELVIGVGRRGSGPSRLC